MRSYTERERIDISVADIDLRNRFRSDIALELLLSRGIDSLKKLEEWNSYDLSSYEVDVYDVDSAWQLLKKHLKSRSSIWIYGDYDVDGVVAVSIMWRFLQKILGEETKVNVYIPSRHEEGYGLNDAAVEKIIKDGGKLIITVDCGVRDVDLVGKWKDKVDFIITDHHQPGEKIPDCAVVHPLYPGKESKNMFTSGSVIAWKFIKYIAKQFGKPGYEEKFLDVVGLSLITDIMPLTGENRAILLAGLSKMKKDPVLGLDQIIKKAGVVRDELSAYHLGYIIGPRLNASGRLGSAYDSLRILATDNFDVAYSLADKLEEVNTKRQEVMKSTIEEADLRKHVINDAFIIAYNPSWDDGVIGLVSGKITQKYGKPSIVMTFDEHNNEIKGSARSVNNLNITEFIEGLRPLLKKYGGHHAAAGLTLATTDFEYFLNEVEKYVKEKYPKFVPERSSVIDFTITPADVDRELVHALKLLEPFGPENSVPLFKLSGTIDQFTMMGKTGTHVRMKITDGSRSVDAVFFNCEDHLSQIQQGGQIIVVGKIKEELFNGNTYIKFFVDDILP
jgi:single-stranded-DNA-specific exonuclease